MTLDDPIVDVAEGLVGVIGEYRDQGEREARLAPAVVDAVGAAGMFRMFAPREAGGLEAPLPVAAAVFERLARVDPAVTWYMGNSAPACFAASRLEPAERDELFAEPDRNFGFSAAPGGRATPTGSGFRLSGEWPLVTGVRDARWCAFTGTVMDGDTPAEVGGRPDVRLFLVPTEVMDIDPIWDESVAMRATGSHRVTVTDAELPGWCAKPPTTPLALDRPLFRLGPAVSNMSASAAIPTGILGEAVDAAAGELASKVSTITGAGAAQSTALLEMVADADIAYQTLRAGIRSASSELWAAAQQEGRGTREQRAAVHGLLFYAARVARETISQLYGRSSRASFFWGHPLERALRNIHAAHYGIEPLRNFQHSVALVRLGQRPIAPGF